MKTATITINVSITVEEAPVRNTANPAGKLVADIRREQMRTMAQERLKAAHIDNQIKKYRLADKLKELFSIEYANLYLAGAT